MRTFRRIAVYCGSSSGAQPHYARAAADLGRQLAERGIGLVYGGGRVGLMGVTADAVLAAGGEAIGVIPRKLKTAEHAHTGCTELFEVESMHDRKMLMAQLSDAFIALPGGWGTLDELCEATTWTLLNYHLKPVGLVNVAGYYDALLAFLDHAAHQGFIRPQHRNLLAVAPTPGDLLDQLATIDLPLMSDWFPSADAPR